MDVQTHARQGPAHVHADVVHGEAPCTHALLTHAHGADLCPPGLKGAAQPPLPAPAPGQSLRSCLGAGDPFACH